MNVESLNAEEIFFQALEIPASERVEFVIKSCGGESPLGSRVLRLLESHDKNEQDKDFLEKALVSRVKNEVEIAESVGDVIGRYKLLEKIGEGGMGVVYMAEQIEGVRRRVALKIIKLGMDTRQVIARFEAERQAMALFDHPNITKVFDAGATQSGRPFFVMELVRGTSVTDFVNKNKLSLNERLDLFVDICRAVQHAHQKGIIHRDLKPSNVLVTLFDGVPVPKVIDFGIAKAIGNQRLTEKTLFTRYAAMVGTPQYMSPEQAEMTGIDVDTRSDIYSLGVLLYELITGSTPIAEKDLNRLNPLALYETLRESEIETPSSRLMRNHLSLEKAIEGSAAQAKGVVANPVDIKPSDRLKGELDWVVMKALARDRTRRYASTNELAEDVSRFLAGMPVLAAPPSRLYKVRTYLRRHRAAVITAAVGASILLTASIACVLFGVKAYHSNQKLMTVNSQLSESVKRLKMAETKIRMDAETQQYDSVIESANFKFHIEMQPALEEMAHQMFPNRDEFAEFELVEIPDELLNDKEFAGSEEFIICLTFDDSELLTIPHKEMLAESIQRLESVFDAEKEFYSQAFDEDDKFDSEIGSHQHSEQCLDFREIANVEVRKYRKDFYKILVEKYRKTFGEKDSRVAEPLNLLASCLIGGNELDFAEAHLRESLALANDVDRKNASKLLAEIRERRQHSRK